MFYLQTIDLSFSRFDENKNGKLDKNEAKKAQDIGCVWAKENQNEAQYNEAKKVYDEQAAKDFFQKNKNNANKTPNKVDTNETNDNNTTEKKGTKIQVINENNEINEIKERMIENIKSAAQEMKKKDQKIYRIL